MNETGLRDFSEDRKMHFSLSGFPVDVADQIAAGLALHGRKARSLEDVSESLADESEGVFICGDSTRWLETLRRIRAARPLELVIVVTRLPDTGKWLDALEAGADDFFCLPLDPQQMRWFIQNPKLSSFRHKPVDSHFRSAKCA
jgi:DNA-binding NtrC family response regulator